jgi:hypothetical protein
MVACRAVPGRASAGRTARETLRSGHRLVPIFDRFGRLSRTWVLGVGNARAARTSTSRSSGFRICQIIRTQKRLDAIQKHGFAPQYGAFWGRDGLDLAIIANTPVHLAPESSRLLPKHPGYRILVEAESKLHHNT